MRCVYSFTTLLGCASTERIYYRDITTIWLCCIYEVMNLPGGVDMMINHEVFFLRAWLAEVDGGALLPKLMLVYIESHAAA